MVQFIDERVNVRITRMRQIDDLDQGLTGQADFQSQITIDGQLFNGRLFEEKDDLNPGFDWSFANTIGSGRIVPFKIHVSERDSGFLGGTGPTVDINPLNGKKDLNLFLDQQTGEIFSTESGSSQRIGFANQSITLRGAGDDSRGEVTFIVSPTPGPEPANSVMIQNPFLSETPESNDNLGGKLTGNNPIATGDFNADGKSDLVVGGLEGIAHIINGTSSGLDQSRLQTKFDATNLGVSINGSAFAVGDFNGDRVDDLLMGGNTSVVRFGQAGNGLAGGQNNILKDPSFPGGGFTMSTVAAGDFNGDGKDDVALGDRFADADGRDASGAVQVNYGSASGITTSNRQVFHRDTPGIPGLTDLNAGFGAALATGDVNADGFEDLVVGAPGAGDTVAGAGAIHILYGSASGLTTANSSLIGQSFSGQADRSGDGFGAAVAVGDVNGDRVADVIVGAPGRNSGAGQVYVYHGRRGQSLGTVASRILTQPDLSGGSAEAGDNFGSEIAAKDINNDGFADVVIGAPGEDNGTGVAHITFGSSAGVTSNVRVLQQGLSGIAGTLEAGDRFGTGIAIGNFDGSGSAEIAVSAPNEDFGSVNDAGLVNIISGISSSSSFSISEVQSTKNGTNKSDILRGTDANGILNGKGGNDRIFTGGGNDIAMGGVGNDDLDAGAGDDLLYGGQGRDTQTGGTGRDGFVLARREGLDLIKDFKIGEDFLGLANDLKFEDLQIVQQGKNVLIKAGNDRIATLAGVKANSLTTDQFALIGFTTFENMTVPTVLG